ncbi:MAG TPA: hypothetical protein VN231_04500 [Allosphingosinicella sp.]|nr:hypothetical protein [Allosphingosinicella sp.]
MGIVSITLIAAGTLALGGWMHEAVADLAAGRKLLLARGLIWGSIAALWSAWLAWKPVIRILTSWAIRAEQSRRSPLLRRREAGGVERVLVGLFLALCAFLTGTAIFAPDAFVRLLSEDGPFETGTTLCYAVSAAACVLLALRARGHRGLRVSLGLLAALFVIVGGEEISWGQRLIGFGTPESIAAVNLQSEFTLHNIYSISIFTYPALATTTLLLFVAPLLEGRSPDFRRIFHAFELPVAPLVCAGLYIVMVAAYLVVGMSLGTPTPLPISYSNHAPHYDDEMLEFLIAALFTVFALSNWRWRLPEQRRTRGAGRTGLALLKLGFLR